MGKRGRPKRTSLAGQRCADAVVQRFLGSVRQECLDQLMLLTEVHVRRVLACDLTRAVAAMELVGEGPAHVAA